MCESIGHRPLRGRCPKTRRDSEPMMHMGSIAGGQGLLMDGWGAVTRLGSGGNARESIRILACACNISLAGACICTLACMFLCTIARKCICTLTCKCFCSLAGVCIRILTHSEVHLNARALIYAFARFLMSAFAPPSCMYLHA